MDVIVFHAWCPDGLAAAAYLSRFVWPGATLLGCAAGDAPPLERVAEKRVIFVDLCPKAEALRAVIAASWHTAVVDHHATAEAVIDAMKASFDASKFDSLFSNDASGATLAYQYHVLLSEQKIDGPFRRHPTWASSPTQLDVMPRPAILGTVEDQDLFRFKLPHTREIILAAEHMARMCATPQGETTADEAATVAWWATMLGCTAAQLERRLVPLGALLMQRQDRAVKRAVARARYCKFVTPANDTFVAAATICSGKNASQVGNALLAAYPDIDVAVAVRYDVKRGQFSLSLRTSRDLAHTLAKAYGGGGHARASGMRAERLTMLTDFRASATVESTVDDAADPESDTDSADIMHLPWSTEVQVDLVKFGAPTDGQQKAVCDTNMIWGHPDDARALLLRANGHRVLTYTYDLAGGAFSATLLTDDGAQTVGRPALDFVTVPS